MFETTEAAPRATRPGSARTKGVIAVVAGAALLIGGAGTYAYWSTEQALSGTVQSGDLNLTLGTPDWTLDGVLTTPVTIPDVSTVRLVPGDVLTLDQPLDVTLVGDTIQALLSVDLGTAVPPAVAAYVDVELTSSVGTLDGANTYRITPAQAAAPIDATLTITFDATTAGRDGVNATIDLSQVSFTLEQASS